MNITIFAPINTAFNSIPNNYNMTEILEYHYMKYLLSDFKKITSFLSFPTLQGSSLFLTSNPNGEYLVNNIIFNISQSISQGINNK